MAHTNAVRSAKKKAKAAETAEAKGLYAAVMLKGTVKIHRGLTQTFEKLSLSRPNTCIVVPADGTYTGMFRKISEFVTWGEISEGMLENLLQKRSKMEKKEAKALAKKAFASGSFGADSKRVFRLSPPSGGIKSVRLNYPRGDMGYRGVEINALLQRMI
jgi:large subunit ribosomal protein L30